MYDVSRKIMLCIFSIVMYAACDGDVALSNEVVTYSNEYTVTHTAPKTELFGENFGPTNKFGYLIDIEYVDPTLVLMDRKKASLFFGLNDDELISFQEVGEGPEMIDDLEFIKLVGANSARGIVNFFDYKTKSLNEVDINADAELNQISIIPERYWGVLQGAVNINDSLAALTGNLGSSRFIVYNKNTGREVTASQNKNSFSESLAEGEEFKIKTTDILYNKKHNVIVLRNAYVNSIDAYSVTGEPKLLHRYGDFKNISSSGVFSQNYFYYYSVKTSGDLVYGLYLAKSQDVMTQIIDLTASIRPELHVHNLQTGKFTRFLMDRLVNVCTIDTERKAVYCIEEDNEDQPIVKYEIPENI